MTSRLGKPAVGIDMVETKCRATRRALLVGGAASAIVPSAGRAQAWPDARTVTVVVPFAPGGGTDVMGRVLAERFGAAFRSRFVVENRTGGGGTVGYGSVIRSAPDGATILFSSVGVALMPALYPGRGYDPVRDLRPVSLVGTTPSLLCVGPSIKAANLAEFIAEAKRRPGELTFASGGVGTGLHLSAELFKKAAGVDIKHVPYRGGAAATADLLGGRVDMIVDIISGARPLVEDGKLRALGITTPTRSRLMPDIPAIAETVPGYDFTTWFALWLPAKAPPEVAASLHAELAKILATPEVQERFTALGLETVGSKPEDFTTYMASELDKWGRIIRELGVTAEN